MDFDEASQAWRANKKYLGGGMFAYKCLYIHSNGKQCTKAVGGCVTLRYCGITPSQPLRNYCKQHAKYGQRE
jgi:hypothetical protein